MQKLIISGMVTKDAELRRTQSGKDVLSFTVVCSNGKDEQGNWRDGTFYDCSLWGKRAASLSGAITKGKYLALEGRPTAREHNGKVYLGMSVNDLDFAGQKPQRDNGPDSSARLQGDPEYGGSYGAGAPMDDEIPF